MRRAFVSLVACAAALAEAPGQAEEGPWRAGVHYNLVETPRATASASGKVHVVEFFWYGCGHCYALDPALEEWDARKPEHIEFTRVPVVWDGPPRQHARLYYTLLALDRPDLHSKVFDAIHQDGRTLAHRDTLTARRLHFGLLANYGVSEEQFKLAYDSARVAEDLKRAEEATLALSIANVPTLVVNGKYTTSVSSAGGPEELLSLLEALADREKAR